LRPKRVKYGGPEQVTPPVEDCAGVEGVEQAGQVTFRSSANSASPEIWLTLASR
jgi:hypothetical protein